MTSIKLERISSLIEWLLLFALIATPIMTLLVIWSHLFGGNDMLHERLNQIVNNTGAQILNGVSLVQSEPTTTAYYPLHTSTRLLGTLVLLLPDLVSMLILWQLRLLFRGYRNGLLFTFEQIRRYRQIGILLCATFIVELMHTPLLGMALTMGGPNVHGSISINSSDFRPLLAGLIVLALALVMREAKLLADEQQLTV